MPGRSPHRRSPPPPPLISRRSPPRGRVRSPDRLPLEMASSSRSRERREFRTSVRRSRSPVPKGRSFSPPLKRKASPSREMTRRTKISKSPIGSRGSSDHAAYVPAVPENENHTVRSGSDRYRETEFEGGRERALPQFRGPEGSVNFDTNELKKFTVEIIRKPSVISDDNLITTITNPDDIAPVRRPDSYAEDYQYYNRGRGKDEGVRPLFMRAETSSASTSKERPVPPEDYRRIVAIDPTRVSGGYKRDRSRERTRYSPEPTYEDSRRQYYSERERSPYERSPPREHFVESREKPRERRASSRDDLRRDLDVRRREERRYSPERHSYEKESDLRTRINEKRSEPHARHEEREHSSRRYEHERERHGRSHHSSPSRERRRPASVDRHEGSRPRREEGWERERESGSDRRRRPHSREREERSRDRYEHSEHYEEDRSRRVQPYKNEYEPKKFYKSYEEKEFIPPPARGRGILPIRRGMPPIIRGRGMVRGMPRGFRGGIMGGMVRGVPRGPFMGMRGFPPRFFPPY